MWSDYANPTYYNIGRVFLPVCNCSHPPAKYLTPQVLCPRCSLAQSFHSRLDLCRMIYTTFSNVQHWNKSIASSHYTLSSFISHLESCTAESGQFICASTVVKIGPTMIRGFDSAMGIIKPLDDTPFAELDCLKVLYPFVLFSVCSCVWS